MNETFEEKLRASAKAGWWTLLIGAIFLSFQWIMYLVLTSSRPSWPSAFWGKGISWDTVQVVWFWGTAIFKFCLWLLALVVIWLTLGMKDFLHAWEHFIRASPKTLLTNVTFSPPENPIHTSPVPHRTKSRL